MNNRAIKLNIDYGLWLHVFRVIARSTDERTCFSSSMPAGGLGNSLSILNYENCRAVATALVLANMNSIILDWAARLSVGNANMNYYIVKQLPVLPPNEYLKSSATGNLWVQLIIPRVLELTYTSEDIVGFANDLGYSGHPFPWDVKRRHIIRSELDAIYSKMYGLDRSDLEWILDAKEPGVSFPTLKQSELKEFGEYRTQRYVLYAYDMLERGEIPDLSTNMNE